MIRRSPQLAAAAIVMISALAGCAASGSTGSVEIEIQNMPAGLEHEDLGVTILDDAGDTLVSHQLSAASSYQVEGLPLGWTTVEVREVCEVSSELTQDASSMKLIIDGDKCTLGS